MLASCHVNLILSQTNRLSIYIEVRCQAGYVQDLLYIPWERSLHSQHLSQALIFPTGLTSLLAGIYCIALFLWVEIFMKGWKRCSELNFVVFKFHGTILNFCSHIT